MLLPQFGVGSLHWLLLGVSYRKKGSNLSRLAMPYLDIAHEVGSREFLRPLLRLGVPARIKPLKYGDFAWYGNGPSGVVRVGVERKQVSEMIGEESRKRFISRQLPGLIKRYQYRFVIIEGMSKVDRADGELMTGKDITSRKSRQEMTLWFSAGWGRGYTFERYVKEQMTVRLKGGVHFIPSGSAEETAFLLHAMFRWWQKEWHEHKSAYALDTLVDVDMDHAIIDERTFRRDVLAKFPGVGWVRSAKVAKHFRSVHAAVCADEDAWMRALGIKQGRTIARTLVRYLQGENVEMDAKGS